MNHIPVLKEEVISYLDPRPNENFVDCTLGFAGHAQAILEKTKPNGQVLGIEWDSQICEKVKQEGIERLVVVNDSYANLLEIIQRENFQPIDGILLDLGMSIWDLEQSGRGFSFQQDEPLDMRYGAQELTAKEIVNQWPEAEIARILTAYGQERFAKNIASHIADSRCRQGIETTFQLIEIIRKSFPRSYKFGKQPFAARTFQALRIAVNDELGNLQKVLPQALRALRPGGRLVIISFQSLEDRLVKNFFKEQQKQGQLRILTKKPIMASMAEIKENPRSRSAKLRAAVKF